MTRHSKPLYHVNATLGENLRVQIDNGRHQWYADEPIKAHGNDTAPTPYELLLGSLAACTVITLRMYAQQKGFELPWVKTIYEFDRIHADDCAECEEEGTGMIERIRSQVTIGGDFTDAQRERLTQIVGRCPVHKTLAAGIRMFDDHFSPALPRNKDINLSKSLLTARMSPVMAWGFRL